MSLFGYKKKNEEAIKAPSNRLWAIREDGRWARWAPGLNQWGNYSEQRAFIFADPTNPEACYYIDPDGSVHHRNIDQDFDIHYNGILAKVISVGGNKRLWAIDNVGCWARWAPDLRQWQTYSEKRKFIFADPKSEEACYYINPDSSVHWRNIDKGEDRSYPGIKAVMISVGADNSLWAIQKNGKWARWAPDLGHWETYFEKREFIFADPLSESICYYADPNGSVYWRNVDLEEEREFPGIKAIMVSVGG
ncbi:MAG: L-arabinonolactonase [Crocinitomix sp.]|jgi:L-arabinonolactonase